jgi:hypothetical protein
MPPGPHSPAGAKQVERIERRRHSAAEGFDEELIPSVKP